VSQGGRPGSGRGGANIAPAEACPAQRWGVPFCGAPKSRVQRFKKSRQKMVGHKEKQEVGGVPRGGAQKNTSREGKQLGSVSPAGRDGMG